MTNKNLEEFLNVSDDMQNELIQLAKKILAREKLTGAEQALLEKIQSVRNQLQDKPNA